MSLTQRTSSRRCRPARGAGRSSAEAEGAAGPAEAARPARAEPACALRYRNDLLPAMLALGRSVGPDEVAHEQCALTLCSVQDGRELPCMSWEHGLLFTARVERHRHCHLCQRRLDSIDLMHCLPWSGARPYPELLSACGPDGR